MFEAIAGALFVVFFGGVVALMVWGLYYQYKKRQQRIAAIHAFAMEHHCTYVPESPERVQYFRSPPFNSGLRPRAKHVVYGAIEGVTFETFAYQYETQSTDSKGRTRTQTHPFQVTWIPLPAALPTMRFDEHTMMRRLATKLGARDLLTESDAFNKRWKVWCVDERIGHAVLTPAMINTLLSAHFRGRAFVIEGRALMSFTRGHTDLRETAWLVGVLAAMAALIPRFLLEDGQRGNPQ